MAVLEVAERQRSRSMSSGSGNILVRVDEDTVSDYCGETEDLAVASDAPSRSKYWRGPVIFAMGLAVVAAGSAAIAALVASSGEYEEDGGIVGAGDAVGPATARLLQELQPRFFYQPLPPSAHQIRDDGRLSPAARGRLSGAETKLEKEMDAEALANYKLGRLDFGSSPPPLDTDAAAVGPAEGIVVHNDVPTTTTTAGGEATTTTMGGEATTTTMGGETTTTTLGETTAVTTTTVTVTTTTTTTRDPHAWVPGTWTTGYWDCCKPSCSWNGKGHVKSPVMACDVETGEPLTNPDEASVCAGGRAASCKSHQPFVVNERLSMGFAAAAVGGEHGLTGDTNCGQCFELFFTSRHHDPYGGKWGGAHPFLAGRTMIVQVTNIGYDVTGDHSFDIQIPGAGQGIFADGCAAQFPTRVDAFGETVNTTVGDFDCDARYGGCQNITGCARLPEPLRAGCEWRFDWYKWMAGLGRTNNPWVEFRRVKCPQELVDISGSAPLDDDEFAAVNITDFRHRPFARDHLVRHDER